MAQTGPVMAGPLTMTLLHNWAAASLRTLGCILSGPGDLDFRFLSLLKTISLVIFTTLNGCSQPVAPIHVLVCDVLHEYSCVFYVYL